MKRLFSLILTLLLFNSICPLYVQAQDTVTVKSGTEIYLSPCNTITSKNEPSIIPAIIKEDVIIDGKVVFKEGESAQIKIADVEKAGFLGNGGRMVLGNGYVKDVNGEKRKVTYSYNVLGKDKTWVKVTM
ncbi:MAG: hypothetical protein LUH11_00415 [Candidatus Gastranaerophilales bacterium]|nr:hypothetical protein [Candidatus Gastranaerophilales bacterium]